MPRPSDSPPNPEASSPASTEETPLSTFFEDILNEIPVAVFVKESKERRFVCVNKSFARIHDTTPAELLGRNDDEMVPEEAAAYFRAQDLRILEGGEVIDMPQETVDLKDRGLRTFHTRKIPLYDKKGNHRYLLGITEDITDRKQAEDALLREREMLETQKRLLEVIRELGTPVIPVFEGILVVPLVGHMDSERGAQFLEALLAGVQQHRAEMVLIDITGVPMMDADVADCLVQATRAASLLGTTCILVGASPGVARTLVELGIDLGELAPQRDLQAGILYALSRQGKAVIKRRSPCASPIGSCELEGDDGEESVFVVQPYQLGHDGAPQPWREGAQIMTTSLF